MLRKQGGNVRTRLSPPTARGPVKFHVRNLCRRRQEVGGGNAPYRVANRQLAQKKKNTLGIPDAHRAYLFDVIY